ncbi:hypothetical protein B0H14DRAFT_2897700 [Mycena olivaceomarginata]|nr:hypothetical protein B0H14DRAFT_2897700 [Mycena olivaceomarginata]
MSARKDRVAVIGMWKAPPNVSKEALETEITSLVDSVLALPVAQKNYLKFEIISQRELANQHIQGLGLPEAPPSVWVMAECASEAHFAELYEDATFAALIEEKHKTLYKDRLTANAFFVDLRTGIDSPITGSRTRVMAAYRCPDHLSPAEYYTKMEAQLEKIIARPIVKKAFQKYYLWIQNDTLDAKLRELGFPEPEPMVLLSAETENDERMAEVLTHPEFKDHMKDAIRDLHLHIESSVFFANVVTKIEKEE